MAKAAWLTVAPASGNGNATVQNTGTVHTGREQRTTTVTGVAVGDDTITLEASGAAVSQTITSNTSWELS